MTDHVHVIAEAGVNHDGHLDRALELVDVAADAGADAVKFQTFRSTALVTGAARQADYQIRNDGDAGSQLAMLQALELAPEDHRPLLARCAERGIEFLSSPFDPASAAFLVDDLGLDTIMRGSGELTHGPLLHQIARSGRRLVLSTGMATMAEVADALAVLLHGYEVGGVPTGRAELVALAAERGFGALADRVTLLHCTTEYPTDPAEVNLRAMPAMAETFGLPVGLSDHTPGIAVALAGVALGATVIEKHVTTDRTRPGPDHAASLEPDELAALVAGVRSVSAALGDGDKRPMPSELGNMAVARKSLVAARDVAAGTVLAPDDLAVKRPGTGRSPMDYWDVLGTPADHDLAADDLL